VSTSSSETEAPALTGARQALKEIISLREFPRLPAGVGLQEIVDALVDLRARIDRVDELVNVIGQLRSRVKADSLERDFVAEQAWNQSVSAQKPSGGVIWGDSSSAPRERYATASLETLPLQRDRLATAKLLVSMDSLHESARTFQYGLNGYRSDLSTRLRAVQFLMTLEQ
jgi:hypothetical protein